MGTVSERKRYTARTPQWTGKPRTSKRKAQDDMAEELGRVIMRSSDAKRWACFAYDLGRRGHGTDPDGGRWEISTRVVLVAS